MLVLASLNRFLQHIFARLIENELAVCSDCRTLVERRASCQCENCNADLCDSENHYTFDGYRYVAGCQSCDGSGALGRAKVDVNSASVQITAGHVFTFGAYRL